MSAVLMSWKPGAMGHQEATAIRMKTPTDLCLIGFSTQEVGVYYIRRLGLNLQFYDFIDLASHAAVKTEKEKDRQMVFFRTEEDVDLHLQDRSKFPYHEFQLTWDDFHPEG